MLYHITVYYIVLYCIILYYIIIGIFYYNSIVTYCNCIGISYYIKLYYIITFISYNILPYYTLFQHIIVIYNLILYIFICVCLKSFIIYICGVERNCGPLRHFTMCCIPQKFTRFRSPF